MPGLLRSLLNTQLSVRDGGHFSGAPPLLAFSVPVDGVTIIWSLIIEIIISAGWSYRMKFLLIYITDITIETCAEEVRSSNNGHTLLF